MKSVAELRTPKAPPTSATCDSSGRRAQTRFHSAPRHLPLLLLLSFCLGEAHATSAVPEVTNVRAAQRPGTMSVDITYDVEYTAAYPALKVSVAVSETRGVYSELVEGLTGDWGFGVLPGKGKRVTWEAGLNWLGRRFTNLVFRIDATPGVIDMHGNVWEWCSDWWTDRLPGGSVSDPTGPSSGTLRVFPGGSADNGGRFCRSAIRDWLSPGSKTRFLGLRVALVQSNF